MLKNYVTTAVRALRKQLGYAGINVLGLAIGLACCILIVLYVHDELSYDRFHDNAERIFRMRVERTSSGETELEAQAAAPMAPAAVNDVPSIEKAVRISRRDYLIQNGDRRFYEGGFLWVDSTFFDVFSFDLLRGDPRAALRAPFSIVLTEQSARKYFGESDPVGKTLQVENWDLTVTGVVAEAPPQSHFEFDMLASFSSLEAITGQPTTDWGWWNLSYHTYLLLDEQADVQQVQAQLYEMPARYVGDQEAGSGYRQFLHLDPLTDIHLHSHYVDELGTNGHAAYIYVFSAIAGFILIIACINFMNLATARSGQRAREVSLRKVVGAGRRQLVVQFLSESILLALMSLAAAFIIIQVALPHFNNLASKELTLNYLTNWPFTLAAIGFAIGVGVLAGIYPAFVLSGFRPIDVFKGESAAGRGAAFLRKGLVVFQFAVSVVLIVGSFVVYEQLRFMQTTNLGFDKEQIVVLRAHNNESHERNLADSHGAFKDAFESIPAVRSVTFSSSVPGRMQGSNVISRSRGFTEDGQTMAVVSVEHDFAETYGLDILAGRDLSRTYATDDSAAYLINESALKALGWTSAEEAIGQELTRQFQDTRTVVGVVKDFHIESLKQSIYPVVFLIDPSWFNYIAVNIGTENTVATMGALESVWNRLSPDRPFNAFFLDDDYDRQYQAERRIGAILSLFTSLAIFIACLGLFALAAFMAQQRRKEIGVRKVLGASAASIVILLSKEFTRLVVLGTLAAAPVAYLLMDRWLQDFAYRIELSWTTFVLAGLAAMIIAWMTVSYQSLRTALIDPVDALRYE